MPKLFLAALIEERTDMAQNLRDREERIGLAAETANFALWTIDFERRESWMSEKGRGLFGFTPDELLSRGVFAERVHPEDREAVVTAMDPARAASEAFEIEFRLLRPDGETRWLNTRGRYLRNDLGEVRELIGVGIDVTDRKQMEDAARNLAHAQRLATVGELTALIAHEINQPLGAILSNADAAEMLLEKQNPRLDEVRQILTDIRKDDLRASEVIRRMRTLLRKRDVEMLPLDLNGAVSEVLRLIETDARRRGVAVEAELDSGLPVVPGDKVHLQQVLLNLVVNSMEAMADTPETKRRLAVCTRRAPDGGAEILVTDAGHGIPADRPQKLFESFYTTKKEGMGLGLSIARSIIEAHHGRIWAENNTDGGATFHFTLPTKAGESGRPEA
jgi:PAS domain S-box-containing protein